MCKQEGEFCYCKRCDMATSAIMSVLDGFKCQVELGI